MKYVLILPDGAADHPCPELGGKTPLAAAEIPHFDRLAREGQVGSVLTAPASKPPGSDVCTMSLLGFDPERYHTGRAPLEAPSLGVQLKPGQTVFRCNLINVTDGKIMDHSAGHITTEEAHALMEAIADELGSETLRFYPGTQYRSLMVVEGTESLLQAECTPPHDVPGQPLADHLPRGPGADELRRLIDAAVPLLADHPVNRARIAAGKRPATHIWLWGQGTLPELPTFAETFGLRGAMIAAVDLLRSLGIYLGFDLLPVEGMTGYLDTNYAGKGAAAVAALDQHNYDLVVVHIEAPDEAGHQRDPQAKARALEEIDAHIAAPLLAVAERRGDVRICVVPDHPTPCDAGVHTRERVPFVLWGPGIEPDEAAVFDEQAGRDSALVLAAGPELMPLFLGQGE